MTERTMLDSTEGQPLLETISGLLVDLDGVVLLGDRLVDGADGVLRDVRAAGVPLVFVTNNASRRPAEVVERLAEVSVVAGTTEVVTSAQAAADHLAGELDAGASVLVVGGAGLHEAVAGAGLHIVDTADPTPAAVVQGLGPDIGWRELAEVTVAVRAGAPWVVTNRDRTYPTARGALPGCGAFVAAVALTLGREPDLVVGKPESALFELALRRLDDPPQPLMVGDRIDTDIGGAARAGISALLVLSGVAGPADVLAAEPEDRPAFIGRDLSSLGDCHPPVVLDGARASCRGVTVGVSDGRVELDGSPDPASDGLDGLRAAATLAWSGQLPAELYGAVLQRLELA
jgi:glycerol-1-phosphatase